LWCLPEVLADELQGAHLQRRQLLLFFAPLPLPLPLLLLLLLSLASSWRCCFNLLLLPLALLL
jgi:hypothetical protein